MTATTRRARTVRVGQGFDVHRFSGDPGRPLVLGGVTVPGAAGLAGHSDADVVAHAVAEAMLGAAGLGDLGRHFPASDPAWAGADSMELLSQVSSMVAAQGLRPRERGLHRRVRASPARRAHRRHGATARTPCSAPR